MTDKQIIIDGVDVTKCRYFTSEWDFNNCGHICKGAECKYKRLWYKKQLKHKEHECEELKEDRERWKSNFNGKVSAIEELLQQLDQLKAKNIKISKTLTEIKEIAEGMNTECFYDDFDCKDCDMKNGCTYQEKIKILQKISEVIK